MRWVLAVDGGGTRTTACVAEFNGDILDYSENGPANYHVIGIQGLAALIKKIIAGFVRKYDLQESDLEFISLGLAGADRPGDRRIILNTLATLNLTCPIIVNTDATIALTAGLGEARGIVLIAGTGSIAYGINSEAVVTRAGGWGHIVSDEGSGYAIGRQALARGLKAHEGRDKNTVLLAKIMEHLNLKELEDLIRFIYNPATDKAAIAALAKVVAVSAEEGDEVANEILLEAAHGLADIVKSVISRGFAAGQPVPVCTFGGVIDNIPLVREAVKMILSDKAILFLPARQPVLGALELGYEHLKANGV